MKEMEEKIQQDELRAIERAAMNSHMRDVMSLPADQMAQQMASIHRAVAGNPSYHGMGGGGGGHGGYDPQTTMLMAGGYSYLDQLREAAQEKGFTLTENGNMVAPAHAINPLDPEALHKQKQAEGIANAAKQALIDEKAESEREEARKEQEEKTKLKLQQQEENRPKPVSGKYLGRIIFYWQSSVVLFLFF